MENTNENKQTTKMAKTNKTNKPTNTTLVVKKTTRNLLAQLKYNFNIADIDSTLLFLLNNFDQNKFLPSREQTKEAIGNQSDALELKTKQEKLQ